MRADADVQQIRYFLESTMGYACDDCQLEGTHGIPNLATFNLKLAQFALQATSKSLSNFIYVGHGWSNSPNVDDAEGAKNLITL